MIKDSSEFLLRVRIKKSMRGVVLMYLWADLNHPVGNDFRKGEWAEEDAPHWVREGMALMNLMEDSTELENIGYRHSDTVVYLTIKGDLYGKRS